MEKMDSFQLTLTQRDILFDQFHNPSNPLYNIGGYIQCCDIDVSKMQQAHQKLVQTTEAFALRICEDGSEIRQYLCTTPDSSLPFLDFSRHAEPKVAATEWLDKVFQQPMEIFDTQLCHAYLLKIGTAKFWYVGLSHHLAMDGMGFANWAHQLAALYNEVAESSSETLSYRDMSLSDQDYVRSRRYESDQAFWRTHCDVIADPLFTPNDM